ncbi:MAG: hypothetical protein A2787_02270 [Omnitrophica WOR_2 bacterium RIFCSPHIGHO2_01_FULL_48_9]|nr:MAG: hypothetical protein A3D10_02065 [Omnitrophica WOR_2 bacterium RIFCSPHIGHO2_02_FULL_48_11]OGX30093.1 MAG: hypothetical protein A2787_02270 [Omnitrophica WOR_2 bacterium RIFCSPHIGHO2_01_FULL_48_9]
MNRKKYFFHFILFSGTLFFLGCGQNPLRPLSAPDALKIARQTAEVQALYALQNRKWAGCIEAKAERPCDSDWVTCIEDAWVVKYTLGERCGVAHDGRLGVTLLVDGKSGKVISRFPETEYFKDELYCRDDFDCSCRLDPAAGEKECKNFIYAPLTWPVAATTPKAQCRTNICSRPGSP